jgi:DNA polymerase-3 subunit alpha
MAALLTSEAQNADKTVKYIAECREMGIEILPPDINESYRDFTVFEGKIRFGLTAVKNVGDAAIDGILQERDAGGKFKSLRDFCRRVDLRKVNKRVIESLIKCSAFDCSGARRSQMMTALEEVLEQSQKAQRKKEEAQFTMFLPGKDTPEEPYPDMDEFPEKQLIAFEKETIGFYISRHPLITYQEEIRRITLDDSSTLADHTNASEVKVCGLINSLKEITTKKGERMAFLTLEDMKGFVEVILFPEVFKSAVPLLGGEDPVLVRGVLDLSEDQVKIKATEILLVSAATPSSISTLHLRVPIGSLDPAQLTGLKEILVIHPGGAEVRLHLMDEKRRETVIALGEKYRVNPSAELQNHVHHLLESSSMSIE